PDGTTLDQLGLRPDASQGKALDAVVADLASARGSDAAEALSTRAVRYVVLRVTDRTSGLEAVLDSQTGLVRRSRSASLELWQVVAPTARLQVLPQEIASRALAGDRAPSPEDLIGHAPLALPAGREGAHATLPSGGAGRLLVLADARDDHWRATLDGKQLPRGTAWGWAQAFVLPPDGGTLVVSYRQTVRHASLIVQGVLVVLVIVLSAPGARRRRGLEDDVDDEDGPTGHEHRTLAVTA
ncbi:MAG: family 2 glycosyl transferase, partial [Frankiales bacterium]|nr:family 2 glycosyl transferase [Frankiales bacterium]